MDPGRTEDEAGPVLVEGGGHEAWIGHRRPTACFEQPVAGARQDRQVGIDRRNDDRDLVRPDRLHDVVEEPRVIRGQRADHDIREIEGGREPIHIAAEQPATAAVDLVGERPDQTRTTPSGDDEDVHLQTVLGIQGGLDHGRRVTGINERFTCADDQTAPERSNGRSICGSRSSA